MAEPIYMWSLKNLFRIRQECQKRMETYWQESKDKQSLEEMAIEDYMFRIDDEIKERLFGNQIC